MLLFLSCYERYTCQKRKASKSGVASASAAIVGFRRRSGLICTGDQFFISLAEDRRILSLYPDGLASDMESAAVAQVCRRHGVPFLSFRTISDIHSGEDEQRSSYDSFWNDIADNSFAMLARLLESI